MPSNVRSRCGGGNLVLEDKYSPGLSAAPDPNEPIELLTEEELIRRAIADRQERAAKKKMTLRSTDPESPWTDYVLTSQESGKSYRVSLRGQRFVKTRPVIPCDKVGPGFSSKLERLEEILSQLIDEPDRKIVLFNEWTTMLDLIEPILEKLNADFVRLDGKVPQKKREERLHKFQNNPNCRATIMSNAGSTGLNLQSANGEYSCSTLAASPMKKRSQSFIND